jgi:SAM-dependent methyltransferase
VDRYCMPDDYTARKENVFFDDTPFADEWQDEVYAYARRLARRHRLKSVLDLGTGSGFKLMKHFPNLKTLGIDEPPTVEYLRKKYPKRGWEGIGEPRPGYELLICADVIEHLPDPDVIIDYIRACAPRMIVFSTPDRSLLDRRFFGGPPENESHCREWTKGEFANYLGKNFAILEHFISHPVHATQNSGGHVAALSRFAHP